MLVDWSLVDGVLLSNMDTLSVLTKNQTVVGVCVCDGGEMLVYKGVENQTKSHEEIEVAKSSGWTGVTNNNRTT